MHSLGESKELMLTAARRMYLLIVRPGAHGASQYIRLVF